MSSAELDELARRLAPLVAPLIARELETLFSSNLRASIPAAPNNPPLSSVMLHRLSVQEFSVCIGRSAEFVRRRIRGRIIRKEFIDGPPYLIHPKALALFAVTPDIAAARLAELRAKHGAA